MPQLGSTGLWACDRTGCDNTWTRGEVADQSLFGRERILRICQGCASDLQQASGDVTECETHNSVVLIGGEACQICAPEPSMPSLSDLTWERTPNDTSSTADFEVETPTETPPSEEGPSMECESCGEDVPQRQIRHGARFQAPPIEQEDPPDICRDCYAIAFKCLDCGSFFFDDEWPEQSHSRLAVCRSCSTDDESPVGECHLCGGEADFSDASWGNRAGEAYCSTCTNSGPVYHCEARWCGLERPRAAGEYDTDAMLCTEHSHIPRLPGFFPTRTPFEWDFREGCGCQACSWLHTHADWGEALDEPTGQECPACNIVIREGHGFVHSGEAYCHLCHNSDFTECPDCGRERHSGEFHPVQGAPNACNDCMEDRDYFFCDIRCGAWFPESRSCNCDGVHGYQYRPDSFEFFTTGRIDPAETPYLGLELEVESQDPELIGRGEGARIVQEIPWAYPVHDGSLAGTSNSQGPGTGGEFGFELVTHPFTWDWMCNNWTRIVRALDRLHNAGFSAESPRCGAHIHISRRPMTSFHQFKFVYFIYSSPNLAMTVGGRDHSTEGVNSYASFTSEDRQQIVRKILDDTNPGVRTHHVAINTRHSASLEARWFDGSIRPDRLRRYLQFVHATYRFTNKYGRTSANEINFMRWLSDPIYKKQYGHLWKFLKRNYVTRR